MTTAGTTLVDRVRDLLDDYENPATTLAAAVATTSETTCTLERPDNIGVGTWLSIDYETLYVSQISSGPPYTATVRRGQRGSTAAVHANGAMVYINPKYPNNRILGCLNASLGKLTKITKDDATLVVVAEQYKYLKPTTIDEICRIEIEDAREASEFCPMRNWEMLDGSYFRIFGDYSPGRNIRVVGISKFTALATTGNMDTDFPDTNSNAINFLIYDATGQLLLQRQGKIASRDSYEGLTDPFGQSQPDHSIRVARQYLAEAENFRRIAVRQCPILQVPVSQTQNPSRQYLTRY
jgi:hypothetical protein